MVEVLHFVCQHSLSKVPQWCVCLNFKPIILKSANIFDLKCYWRSHLLLLCLVSFTHYAWYTIILNGLAISGFHLRLLHGQIAVDHNPLAKIIQLIPYPLNNQPLKSVYQQFNPGLGWLGLIPWLIGWMDTLWERGKGKWGKGMENQPKNKTATTSWRKKLIY